MYWVSGTKQYLIYNFYQIYDIKYCVSVTQHLTSFFSKMIYQILVIPWYSTHPQCWRKVTAPLPQCPAPVLINSAPCLMGIRDRAICNGTTGYFGLLVEQGHRLFCGLALRGHGLFQCRISTGPKIILKYSHTGPWIFIVLYAEI